ncbi:phosphoribosylamine--glycine ligase [Dermabacteraceae bacterium P13138]
MKILVIGSGGREHALVARLARDPQAHVLHSAPGNPGIAEQAETHPVNANDPAAVCALARTLGVDLVVIGPEAPLVAGVADALRAAQIPVFGPSADAARLEGSKSFAKDVMAAAQIPTAAWVTCTSPDQLPAALETTNLGGENPYVVKADGLAAGKGVVVTKDLTAAIAHGEACLSAPGGSVVIEEYLDGPEVSLFCVSDGETVRPLAPAQDYKRALDGNDGPNTGGMGAYSPLPWAPAELTEQVLDSVARPLVAEMARRGTPFSGLLYCGLALTRRGLRVVEFNARFGDPETQVVLERLTSPLGELLHAAATGALADLPPLTWSDDAAVTVVLASPGYPETSTSDLPVRGVKEAAATGCRIIHAGTKTGPGGELLTAGGRVLCVVGTGKTVADARAAAYRGVAEIEIPGGHNRSDIAALAEDAASAPPRPSEEKSPAAGGNK